MKCNDRLFFTTATMMIADGFFKGEPREQPTGAGFCGPTNSVKALKELEAHGFFF